MYLSVGSEKFLAPYFESGFRRMPNKTGINKEIRVYYKVGFRCGIATYFPN